MADENKWTLEKMRQQSDEFLAEVITGDRAGTFRRLLADRVWGERIDAAKSKGSGRKENKGRKRIRGFE